MGAHDDCSGKCSLPPNSIWPARAVASPSEDAAGNSREIDCPWSQSKGCAWETALLLDLDSGMAVSSRDGTEVPADAPEARWRAYRVDVSAELRSLGHGLATTATKATSPENCFAGGALAVAETASLDFKLLNFRVDFQQRSFEAPLLASWAKKLCAESTGLCNFDRLQEERKEQDVVWRDDEVLDSLRSQAYRHHREEGWYLRFETGGRAFHRLILRASVEARKWTGDDAYLSGHRDRGGEKSTSVLIASFAPPGDLARALGDYVEPVSVSLVRARVAHIGCARADGDAAPFSKVGAPPEGGEDTWKRIFSGMSPRGYPVLAQKPAVGFLSGQRADFGSGGRAGPGAKFCENFPDHGACLCDKFALSDNWNHFKAAYAQGSGGALLDDDARCELEICTNRGVDNHALGNVTQAADYACKAVDRTVCNIAWDIDAGSVQMDEVYLTTICGPGKSVVKPGDVPGKPRSHVTVVLVAVAVAAVVLLLFLALRPRGRPEGRGDA